MNTSINKLLVLNCIYLISCNDQLCFNVFFIYLYVFYLSNNSGIKNKLFKKEIKWHATANSKSN